jgi:hypothetical protein
MPAIRNAALPTLRKMNPWWLRFGEHGRPRKQVLVSLRLKDTINAIESDFDGSMAEPKDSLDQHTKPQLVPVSSLVGSTSALLGLGLFTILSRALTTFSLFIMIRILPHFLSLFFDWLGQQYRGSQYCRGKHRGCYDFSQFPITHLTL